MPPVNPEILRWARETAGLEVEEAARKISLGPARGLLPAERLRALEGGDQEPTRALLVRMAKHYRRPLLTFYLPTPPARGDRGQDFRSLPENRSASEEAILDALVRDVVARQAVIRSALEAEDEVERLAFVGSLSSSAQVDDVVQSIKEVLGLNLGEFRAQPNPTGAFRLLREATEAAGVIVILQGDLGSHHTALPLSTFRGFALADPLVPFVVVNTNDSRRAWSFTLLHELTHIWLGQTGVSGDSAELRLEQFCNDVASEYLLPASELARDAAGLTAGEGDLLDRLDAYAWPRNISTLMLAFRLFKRQDLTAQQWRQVRSSLDERWRASRDQQKRKNRETEGGPDYYVVRRHRLGPGFLAAVDRLLLSGTLSTTKAGTVLGVKPKNVASLLEPLRMRA